MTIDILAGFECGLIHDGRLDLLAATRHEPHDRQGIHYGIARGQGVRRCRDGLPFHKNAVQRIKVAQAADMEVIWDLCHFDPVSISETRQHATAVGAAMRFLDTIRLCPMNEPSVVPMLTGGRFSQNDAIERAKLYMQMISDNHPNPVFYSVDVINGGGHAQFAATDVLVATGQISVVGINYYPQWSTVPLRDVIATVWKRYSLPVMISETSWHDGHPGQADNFPAMKTKGRWFRHVLNECEIAQEAGAEIDGLCWYPFTDMPSWDVAGEVWSSGLIRQDLTMDESLMLAIRAETGIE